MTGQLKNVPQNLHPNLSAEQKNRMIKMRPPVVMNFCDTLSCCCHTSRINYYCSCWGRWDVFAQPDYNWIGSLGNDLH